MNPSTLIPVAWLLDQSAGDPGWLPHPVRLIGSAITAGESVLRRPGQSELYELLSGGVLTIVLVGSTYYLTAQALRIATKRSAVLGWVVEALLGWTCLAAKNLQQEALAALIVLREGDLPHARRRLARIVGRDTHDLPTHEVCRGLVETIAESAADGIIAPLFYMALGGVPMAMAYKTINTLDSMIGHADERYSFFGKAAARLDDLANYLPARLTAAGIMLASLFATNADALSSWRTWRRDAGKHKSPNAGQPESAMAGALRVRLGGDNTYDGVRVPGPYMGEEFPLPTCEAAARSLQIVSTVTIMSVIGACTLLLILSPNLAGHFKR